MTKPPPFETTISARLLLIALSTVTIGGGVISVVALNRDVGVPLILVGGTLAAFFGILLAIHEHPGHALIMALIGPFALWPMTMVTIYAATHPTVGWALLALGAVPIALALASRRKAHAAPARAPVRAHA